MGLAAQGRAGRALPGAARRPPRGSDDGLQLILSARAALALVAGLLSLAAPTDATAAGKVPTPYRDSLAYDADLTSSADGRTWTGTEAIAFHNASHRQIDRIWLRLWGNGPVGCGDRAVKVTVTAGGRPGRTERSCTALEVLLPSPLQPGAQASLSLNVAITAPQIHDRFGNAEGIWLFGNALPVIAQHDAAGWRLPSYSAYGESWVTTWARFSLTLHHPAALEVAASGTTVTTADPSGGTATTTSVIDARDTFWAIGQMGMESAVTSTGVRVQAWSALGAGGDREDALEQAVGAMDQLNKRLPLYPYPEYDVIVAHIDAGGGMEYPSVVLTDASSEVTRHETGHQWFYGLVGNDQFREPWIDEGLTSFLEYTWTTEAQLPEPDCVPARRFIVPDPQTFITSSMTYWNKHVGQYGYAYDNPVCALRDIRRAMGTRLFNSTLRAVVTRHERGFLSGAALRREFRRAGGRKIDALWARWGLAPGRG